MGPSTLLSHQHRATAEFALDRKQFATSFGKGGGEWRKSRTLDGGGNAMDDPGYKRVMSGHDKFSKW